MTNYLGIALAALEAARQILHDLESGKITPEQARLRIDALKADRANDAAEDEAALRARFPAGNKPGI